MKSTTKFPRKAARVIACTALAMACFAATGATTMQFTPLAGGWTGDGGQARNANMHGTRDVAFDSAGNMYVAQHWANRIRKIAPDGTITTIAGGKVGFGGDGGPAANALINWPTSLTIDAAGNLFFIDSNNRRVRKISATGIITTVAGNGQAADTGDGGAAIDASFLEIDSLAVDKNGNLFVGDWGAKRIRKVTAGGVISHFAGNGGGIAPDRAMSDGVPAAGAGIGEVFGIDVDKDGNVFFVSLFEEVVFRVSTTGTLTWYATTISTYDVKVDAAGNVYVGNDCAVTKIAPDLSQAVYGGPECGISPEGTPATGANHLAVEGIAVDAAGNIYGAEAENQRVFKIDRNTLATTTFAGGKLDVPNGTPGLDAKLTFLNALAVDEKNSVVFADYAYAYRIRRLTNGLVSTIGGTGGNQCAWEATALATCFQRPTGIATAGGVTYVADRSLIGVFRIAANGTLTRITGDGTTAENVPANTVRVMPRGIGLDDLGNLYVSDYSALRIRKITPGGVISTLAGNGTQGLLGDNGKAINASVIYPGALAVDALRNVYYYDATGTVRRIGTDGFIRRVAGYPAGEAPPTADTTLPTSHRFSAVTSLAVHPSGVYIADDGVIKRLTPWNRIETVAGWTYDARGLAIRNSFLYISTGSGRVQRAPLPRITSNDFTGDRKSDLFWRATTGANVIWPNAASSGQKVALTMSTQVKLAAQGDFDGDGKNDLFWRNTVTGANVIWRDGNANTQMVTGAVADQNWQIAGSGDFNGDGKTDVLWRHKTNGQNRLWWAGNSAWQLALTAIADQNWKVAGIGDFDGDGKSDIVWRHATTGANEMWSAGLSTKRTVLVGVTNTAWKVAAVGDFNGDGVSDLFWRNSANGQNAIWKSANNATQQPVTHVTSTAWTVATTGDFDNDGVSDLFWRNTTTGQNTLWLNAASTTQRAIPTVATSWSIQPYEGQP